MENTELSDTLKDHWRRYTQWCRDASTPEARSMWGQCAAAICHLAQDIERKENIEMFWLPPK